MTDTDFTSDRRPISPRATVLLSLFGGAAAGAVVFAALEILTPPPPEPAQRDVASSPPARRASVPAPPLATVSSETELEELQAALALAEAERSQLAGAVLALNRRAETLETRLGALSTSVPTPEEDAFTEGALPSGETGEILIAGEQGAEPPEDDGEAPVDSLVAAGLDPQTAADIRRRRNEFQLARLELVDRAAREGWDEERLDTAIESIERDRPDLREELGDETYDRYLFEEGGNNRVGIASVIPGSAADLAGLADGDIVLSYAGDRVFRLPDLQSATREGSRGELVQLSVLRDGEIVAIDVARGPLGVTLNGARRPPG